MHGACVVLFGHTPGQVAAVTLASTTALVFALGTQHVLRLEAVAQRTATWRSVVLSRGAAVVAALTLAALAVRLLAMRGLWVDEAISVHQARMPLMAMLRDLRDTDVHPPLHHLLLWITVRVVGTGEIAVRIPSLIAGALLVPAVHGLARELYGKRTAVLAATLTIVAPFAVWYSQEARMYSLFMLFAALSLWTQLVAYPHQPVVRMVRVRRGVGRARVDAVVRARAARAATDRVRGRALEPPRRSRRHPFSRAPMAGRNGRAGVARCPTPAALLRPARRVPQPRRCADPASDECGQRRGDRSRPGLRLRRHRQPDLGGWWLPRRCGDGAARRVVAGRHARHPRVLGRRSRPQTKLLVTLAVAPLIVLALLGTVKRDLFEVRYAAGVVPVAIVLIARAVTGVLRSPRAVAIAGTALVLIMRSAWPTSS